MCLSANNHHHLAVGVLELKAFPNRAGFQYLSRFVPADLGSFTLNRNVNRPDLKDNPSSANENLHDFLKDLLNSF